MLTLARLATLLALLAAGLALAGCGDSGSGDSTLEEEIQQLKDAKRERELAELRRRLKAEKEREAREKILQTPASPAEPKPASSPSGGSGAGLAGFSALEGSLPGQVGLAIGPPGGGPAASAGGLTTGSAWSTSKVPVALRVLQEAGGPSGLSSSQEANIRAALTASDNDAALALFADLERSHGGPAGAAAAVDEVLAEAGDTTTHVSSVGRDGFTPFGQTEWSLELQELFMSRLAAGCVGSPASRELVLGLMGEVSSDTWGLGSTGLPARWKGGWGPGTDGRYLARQMGTLSVEGGEAVIALAALPDDGSFETAQSMATAVAQWAAERATSFAGPPGGC
ncbi:MAG TPA: hypothetical protein VN733_01755 [Solirubrobacterales bacterium]|nr:hypothetical protein [Solirubrobacterales bacterium]